MPKTTMADFRYKSLNNEKSIWHSNAVNRFSPISVIKIDKNHLIASDFCRYRFLSIDFSGKTRTESRETNNPAPYV